MGRRRRSALPASVKKVRDRVEYWRRTREKRSPMPEDLWDAAASLARAHGVCPIARDLRLNYETLKKRVSVAQQEGRDGADRSAGFIELNGAQLVGSLDPAGAVVELSGADGAKMMIRMRESEDLDILGLADAFWSRGA